jgi:hypothetical protein
MTTELQHWLTVSEFARMMGRSPRWAHKYASCGYFHEFGIQVIRDECRGGGRPDVSRQALTKQEMRRVSGSRKNSLWYISVPDSML